MATVCIPCGELRHRLANLDYACGGQGLDAAANKRAFIRAMKRLFGPGGRWATMNPAQRRRALQRIVNQALRRAGAPPTRVVASDARYGVTPTTARPVAPPTKGLFGGYQPSSGTLSVHPGFTDTANLAPGQQAKLAGTLYHETRHAEQTALAARYQAGELRRQGKTPRQIEAALRAAGVSRNMARWAARRPMRENDRRFKCAKNMWAAKLKPQSRDYNRRVAEKKKEAKKKLDQALADFKKYNRIFNDPASTPDQMRDAYRKREEARRKAIAARREHQTWYGRYRNEHHEYDAFKVGDSVQKEYLKP